MRIWTVQTRDVLDTLEKEGTVRSNGICCDDSFREAYAWMTGKLASECGPAPEGVTLPIWGWIRYHGKPFGIREYPDNIDGKVLIEADVPDEVTLASDFEEWHCVLNGFPHESCPAAVERWEKWIDERIGHNDPMPDDVRNLTEQSWDGIFHADGDTVQAVFWELRKEWIVRATPLRQTLARKLYDRINRYRRK